MFKKFIFIFYFVMLSSSVFTQSFTTDYDQNILVSSYNVNENLLLFTPDTVSQILFNPARGFNYDKQFIYATYNTGYSQSYYSRANIIMRIGDIVITDAGNLYPRFNYYYPQYSFKLPTISIASLYNMTNTKWLFVFSNGIRYLDSDDQSIHDDWFANSYPDQTKTLSVSQDSDSKFSTTSMHISRIDKNFSIGVFGIFNQVDVDSRYNKNFQNYRNYGSSSNFDSDSDTENVNYNGNQYLLGISMGFTGQDWDFVGKLSYQKTNNIYDGNYEFLDHHIDSTGYDSVQSIWNVYRRNFLDEGITSIKGKPDIYLIYSYYQKKLALLSPNDHLFFKVNGNISSGALQYNFVMQNLRQYLHLDTLTSADTMGYSGNGSLDSENSLFNFSFGYTYSLTYDDIYLLVSLIPYYQYAQITDLPFQSYRYNRYNYSNQFSKRNRTFKAAGIKFPVYINFSPDSWINIFGGLTYKYDYSDLKEEYHSLNEIDSENINHTNNNSSQSFQNSISSVTSKFLGMILKHKSGLRLQIAFRNDLANYSSWDMSLGYHF